MTLRLLWHTVTLQADDDVLAVLMPLMPQAGHPMPPLRSMSYTARRTDDGYDVREEGDGLTVAPTAAAASEAIYVRAHRRAFELASLAGWVRVHAVTVDLDGNRVLLVGPSGVGKTVLALRMLLDGHRVHGDESALVRAGASVAVPRAFHLKTGSERLVPELAHLVADLPQVADVRVVDPATVTSPWCLVEAPIDHVVLLQRGSEPVTCTPAASVDVLEALVRDAFVVTESRAALLRTLVAAIGTAHTHRLSLGDPATTVAVLRRCDQLASRTSGRNRTGVPMADEFESALEATEPARRSFLKRLAVGSAFAAPVVSSFTMSGIKAVYAQTPNVSGQVQGGQLENSSTSSTTATTAPNQTTTTESTTTTTQGNQ